MFNRRWLLAALLVVGTAVCELSSVALGYSEPDSECLVLNDFSCSVGTAYLDANPGAAYTFPGFPAIPIDAEGCFKDGEGMTGPCISPGSVYMECVAVSTPFSVCRRLEPNRVAVPYRCWANDAPEQCGSGIFAICETVEGDCGFDILGTSEPSVPCYVYECYATTNDADDD
jgi:hypothetical protein